MKINVVIQCELKGNVIYFPKWIKQGAKAEVKIRRLKSNER